MLLLEVEEMGRGASELEAPRVVGEEEEDEKNEGKKEVLVVSAVEDDDECIPPALLSLRSLLKRVDRGLESFENDSLCELVAERDASSFVVN